MWLILPSWMEMSSILSKKVSARTARQIAENQMPRRWAALHRDIAGLYLGLIPTLACGRRPRELALRLLPNV